jgi:adenosylmethionine-8-amino-7-oxononanoate aminotransferase
MPYEAFLRMSSSCCAHLFTDLSNEPAARLAAELAGPPPADLNHVFFTLRRLYGQ